MTNSNLNQSSLRAGKYLLIGSLTIFVLKAFLAAALDLYSDEIFYWQASTRPALAYSDLPFMAALLSGLGTALFGNSAFAVRSMFLLLGTTIPLLVLWIARPLVTKQQALEAAALSLCLPLSAFLGLLAVPDVPLLFFGLLLIGFLERATRLNSIPYWLAAGIAAALGVSTHYRFALYILAAFVYLVAFRDQRLHWSTPGLWLALIITLSGLYPAVAFNLANQLSGIDYHLLERHPWDFQAEGLLHPFKQAVLVTPLLYAALLLTLVRLLQQARDGDSRRGLFGLFALINLGVYMVLAPWTDNTRTSIHWPLSGYLPLLIFLPETLRELHSRISQLAGTAAASRTIAVSAGLGFTGALIALLGVGSQSMQDELRPLVGKGVLSNKMAGWRQLERRVESLLQSEEFTVEPVLVTDNYYTGAQLELSLAGSHRIYNIDRDKAIRDGRAVQYALWNINAEGLGKESGRDALFITEDTTLTVPDKIAVMELACTHFETLTFLDQLILFGGEKSFSFYRGLIVGGEDNRATCPLPTLGWLDEPMEGARIADSLTVSGWLINEGGGVDSVAVLINGDRISNASYGIARPDVVRAMNVMADPNAPNLGFSLTLNKAQLPRGQVELSIRVTAKSGEVQEFGNRTVILL